MTDIPEIIVSTALLEAVARWALDESANTPHLSQVVFRDSTREMLAVDGCRLVRVPIATNGLSLAICRCDALAATAAARALGSASIRIRKPADGVIDLRICAGDRPVTRVIESTLTPPPIDELCDWLAAHSPSVPPAGIAFNPKYLAAVHEIVQVIEPGAGVIVKHWGGLLDPTLYEGPAGSRFVIMPMRQS